VNDLADKYSMNGEERELFRYQFAIKFNGRDRRDISMTVILHEEY